ncbi:GGL domain-containing protein [Apiospora rasikravindrae]|uniref:Guanine nucleotide-binding protein subunit gamma n=1 Tax=Apiospora rasikravindrae TaxID=990691 RepID=A0ABR1UCE1_9PEZI
MPQYTSRDVGDPSQIKKNKQSMADLKLRRLTELNSRLREDLERERIPVSQASKSIIAYCNSTRDYMVPSESPFGLTYRDAKLEMNGFYGIAKPADPPMEIARTQFIPRPW